MVETRNNSGLHFVRALALLCCLFLLYAVTAAGQTASLIETRNRLHSITVDELATDVPPAAKPLLVLLKHQLRDLLLDTLNGQAGRSVRAEALQARARAKLRSMGIKMGINGSDTFDQPLYGDIVDLSIQRPPKSTGLLAVTTTISIHCGLDSSLYLFQRKGARWRLLLADEANNYKDISGGQGLFGYGVAPPDHRGKFFVVTVNVNPWCSSNWQSIRYKVLRPGIRAEQPEVVLSREAGIFLGVEPVYNLNVKSSGFTLTFTGAQHLDAGLLTRLYVENFMVDEKRATRIAPVADRPESFLDEWIQLPWSEAARWTAPAARSELKRWHERLQKIDRAFLFELLFIQPCDSRRREWQIGALIEGRNSSSPLPSKLFFTIVRQHRNFFLGDISTGRPAGCPGEASPYS